MVEEEEKKLPGKEDAVPKEEIEHPEDVNPLGDAHVRPEEERRVMFVLAICFVASVILVPVLAVFTGSPLVNVFVGLLPLLVTLLGHMIITNAHYKRVSYWMLLAVVHVLALGFLWPIAMILVVPMNITGAVGLSLIFATVMTFFVWLVAAEPHRTGVPDDFKFEKEKLDEYVQSIEDKVKALNFVIGRVYKKNNGGTPDMRERIRILREWYNDYAESTEDGDDVVRSKILLHKIRDRLATLEKKENQVFSKKELNRLKNIARSKEGNDTLIDVLKTNDRDPVESYHVSALEFCDKILEALDRL
ncbi:hypothetical protein GOV11_03660 [Candidatus Woesearchaeota archaeon]|nr:hypothetical protein [Candidatus Woesearchaeota archaeon]